MYTQTSHGALLAQTILLSLKNINHVVPVPQRINSWHISRCQNTSQGQWEEFKGRAFAQPAGGTGLDRCLAPCPTEKQTNKTKTKTKAGPHGLCRFKAQTQSEIHSSFRRRNQTYLPVKYVPLNFFGCLISMGRKNPSLSHYLFRQIKELFHLASNTVGVTSDHKQHW